ncbi:MAG: glycosyltransferase family 39 protein [Planctomycetota bacterium]
MQTIEKTKVNEPDIWLGDLSQWSFFWRRLFPVLAVCFAAKCLVAWLFPFTGDEAYLALWGRQVAWGYYDHPPVLAWILHLVQYVSGSYMALRLIPIIFTSIVGVGIYALLSSYDRRKAYLAFVLLMVSPANMAFFIVITDVPLLLFSFLSGLCLFRAERDGPFSWFLLSGIFLGLAFLSKYFAVMLGFSFAVYLLLFQRDKKSILGFFLLILGAFPFIAQNILWNYSNGWPNVMHNFFNRLESDANPLINLLALTVFIIYIMTLPVLYFVFKNRGRLRDILRTKGYRLFVVLSLLPLMVFFAASFVKGVRPHWYASFVPFAYIASALFLDSKQLLKSIKLTIPFSLLQVCIVIAVPFIPVDKLDRFINAGDRASFVVHLQPEKVVQQLDKYSDCFVLASKSYSMSSLLEYYSRQKMIVFGKGSRHGRQDDLRTNFKDLEGKNILILRKKAEYDGEYDPCFSSTQIKHFQIEGAPFSLVLGYGFSYPPYKKQYIKRISDKYYKMPEWLPGSRCFFHEKYDLPL